MKLILKYLKEGLAVIKLEENFSSIEILFVYVLNGGLLDLIKSGVRILNFQSTSIEFSDPPNPSKILKIDIIDHFSCYVQYDSFSEIVSIKEFTRSILRMFDIYIYEYSEKEYEMSWRKKFPKDEIEKLRSKYKKYESIRITKNVDSLERLSSPF